MPTRDGRYFCKRLTAFFKSRSSNVTTSRGRTDEDGGDTDANQSRKNCRINHAPSRTTRVASRSKCWKWSMVTYMYLDLAPCGRKCSQRAVVAGSAYASAKRSGYRSRMRTLERVHGSLFRAVARLIVGDWCFNERNSFLNVVCCSL